MVMLSLKPGGNLVLMQSASQAPTHVHMPNLILTFDMSVRSHANQHTKKLSETDYQVLYTLPRMSCT